MLSSCFQSPSSTSANSGLVSPEELNQAKILVLDLLGWGVHAEYLVTSGVSPAVIFRVFTDLNLQLPTNLEVSDELTAVAYSWGPRPELLHSTKPNSLVCFSRRLCHDGFLLIQYYDRS